MDLLMVFNIQHFYEFTSMRDKIRNSYSGYSYASFMEKRFHHNNKKCGADFSLDYRWHGYNHGGFCDSSVKCPKCGNTKLDYYDRVIGYLTKISNWSEGRQKEQKTRVYEHIDKN